METAWLDSRIDSLLKSEPSIAGVLDALGIDYCCGGARTLRGACVASGIDPARLEALIAESARVPAGGDAPAALGLTELADQIEKVHHGYLKAELPRLAALADKVARVHGGSDPRLVTVQGVFRALAEDLAFHLQKEEQVLFPAIREMERSGSAGGFHCGSLAAPVSVMEGDHADAAAALKQLRGLTGGYAAPEWACNTYLALLDGLRRLDEDMAEHVRKEEGQLFPRAMELERFLLERSA